MSSCRLQHPRPTPPRTQHSNVGPLLSPALPSAHELFLSKLITTRCNNSSGNTPSFFRNRLPPSWCYREPLLQGLKIFRGGQWFRQSNPFDQSSHHSAIAPWCQPLLKYSLRHLQGQSGRNGWSHWILTTNNLLELGHMENRMKWRTLWQCQLVGHLSNPLKNLKWTEEFKR
jgi:hypothetical protein